MGQQLKNPPVYFTVAQARFNPLLKLVDYLPAIQDALRKAGYPAFTKHTSFALQFGVQDGQAVPQPVPLELYAFANIGQTHVFTLGSDTLTFQSTSYGTFETFSTQFLDGLSILHQMVNLDFTDRVGLRYLDQVLPKQGESVNQYLAPEVQGMSAHLGGQTLHSYAETLSAFDHVQLRSRVVIQDGGLSFPPDVQPQGMVVEGRFAKCAGRHAVLDTDGFVERRQAFSKESVTQELDDIHQVIGAAFKATVTSHAMLVWNE